MNKKYIKPQTEIIEIETQSMMAASILEVKETVVNEDMSKGHGSLPGFDLWGDEEE